ncbi:MAG: hypothetical protein ACRC9K_02310 [Afipia sp.]
MSTTTETDDTQDELPEISDTTREYLLSEAGIEHFMRALSDAYENWRDCPVKRCRRARCCQGPDMVCQLKEPRLNAPPENIARVNARMRQVVERQLEKMGIW